MAGNRNASSGNDGMTHTYSRREFIALGALLAFGGTRIARAGRKPPSQHAPADYAVLVPDFLQARVSTTAVAYLNRTIPAVFDEHRHLFPALSRPPQFIVLDTLTDVLAQHGNRTIAPERLGPEALTLFEAQHLLITTRFGSVSTPHRGDNLDLFGQFIYLKQHPRTGYRTPAPLLLEEMLHAQQDATVMRAIIQRDALDARSCLHGPLKGISELGAHAYIETMANKGDYVFVLDDGTHCESAAHGVALLAARLNAEPDALIPALLYDTDAYLALDAAAVTQHDKHLWQMVTTWRHARDENGQPTGIAPAFIPFEIG